MRGQPCTTTSKPYAAGAVDDHRRLNNMEHALNNTTALNFATILDDTINQLSILGKLLPVTLQDAADSKHLIGESDETILKQQTDAQQRLETAIAKHSQKAKRAEMALDMAQTSRCVEQAMRDNPLLRETFMKIQNDRHHCEDVLARTQAQLVLSGEFTPLLEAVHKAQQVKDERQAVIMKQDQSRRTIVQLQRLAVETRREKASEIGKRDEIIAHLKDQLQEMKAKTNIEGKFMRRHVANRVRQKQKQLTQDECTIRQKLEELRVNVDNEERTHEDIINYLKTHQHRLEDLVDYWMEKYDDDVEAKTQALNTLKIRRRSDMERLEELTYVCIDYEKEVIECQTALERERQRKKLEEKEIASAITLQSWWRRMLVTNQLLRFGGKKKAKKGGGKGKKNK